MTKKQYEILQRHNQSELFTLWDCYERPSQNKIDAFNKCRDAYLSKPSARNFKIISYNTNMFSIGFYYYKVNTLMFHYETNKTIMDFEID